jgi:hypothetical protein
MPVRGLDLIDQIGYSYIIQEIRADTLEHSRAEEFLSQKLPTDLSASQLALWAELGVTLHSNIAQRRSDRAEDLRVLREEGAGKVRHRVDLFKQELTSVFIQRMFSMRNDEEFLNLQAQIKSLVGPVRDVNLGLGAESVHIVSNNDIRICAYMLHDPFARTHFSRLWKF